MKSFINNLSIKKKLLYSFGIAVVLLLIVSSISYYTIANANNGFVHYRNEARDNNLCGLIQADMLMVRMNAKDFIITGNEHDIKEYNEYYNSMKQYVDEGLGQITDTEELEKLKVIDRDIHEYGEAFQKIQVFKKERNDIVYNILSIKGKDLEYHLSEIMSTAHRDGDLEAAYFAGEAQKNLLLARLYVMKFLDENDVSQVERVEEEFDHLNSQIVNLDSKLQNRQRRQLLAKVQDEAEAYEGAFAKLKNVIFERNDIIKNTLDRIGPEVAGLINEIKLDIKAKQDQLGPALQASNLQGEIEIIIVSIIALTACLTFGYFLSNMISKPVNGALAMMNELSKGRLSKRMKSESKDEIGQMANGMDNYADTLQQIVHTMDEIADGNLSVEVKSLDQKDEITPALNKIVNSISNLRNETDLMTSEALNGNLKHRGNSGKFNGGYREIVSGFNNTLDAVVEPVQESAEVLQTISTGDLTARMEGRYKGDFALLKDSVNDLGDSLSNLIGDVTEAVEATANASTQISSSTEEMAAGAQEQSAQATEVASSVEQMTKTILESANSASKASEASKHASMQAHEGAAKIDDTKKGMDRIVGSAEETGQIISSLAGKTDQIGEITQVIDDIADQTNLLALNAAIEAARAGEQGRGFAVVADEVRKLAERTTKATKEIADTIRAIQKEAKEADTSMTAAKDSVMDGIKLTEEVDKVLHSILENTENVDQQISQVAAASEEQSTASEQISKSIEGISSVTHQSASGTQQIARTAEDLNNLTEKLHNLIKQFKIDNIESKSFAIRENGRLVTTV